jgi:predicted DNA-binding protein
LTRQGNSAIIIVKRKEAYMAKEVRMPKEARMQIGLNMPVALYNDLSKLAKDNGHTTTYLLERAVEHYIQFVAPKESVVRPEIMAHVRRSVEKNRKLLQLLAEEKSAEKSVAL